ncbi:MAG: DUF1682 domain-containing protein [Deltaproteobacteria bacterium]|nr:DUF1682 domain-containing protein [Deltaproteobacteria bacterium]
MSNVTVRKAALLTGKSRETINSATKDGTLSYTLNSRKHKVIDVAELSRVYELVKTIDEVSDVNAVSKSQPPSETDSQEWRARYLEMKGRADAAESKVELMEKHHTQERGIFEDQVDNLKDSLRLAQEGHNKATFLLEDQRSKKSGAGEWEKAIKALEARLANQEKAEKKHEEREQKILRQNQALRKALKAEREKGVFKKLFG